MGLHIIEANVAEATPTLLGQPIVVPELQAFYDQVNDHTDWQDMILDSSVQPPSRFLKTYPMYRTAFAQMAGPLRLRESRLPFLRELDLAATVRSDDIKNSWPQAETMRADVLVIGGGGAHGQAALSTLRMLAPNLKIISIDSAPILGGVFGRYGGGYSEIFELNSRGHRADNGYLGVPGGKGNLNPLGVFSLVQLPQFESETYASNLHLRAGIAVNSFAANPTVLGMEFQEASKKGGRELVTLTDVNNGASFYADVRVVIDTSGNGIAKYGIDKSIYDNRALLERSSTQLRLLNEGAHDESPLSPFVANNIPGVIHTDQLLPMIGSRDFSTLYRGFVGKRIGVVGGGDTSLFCLEWLTRQAGSDAYGVSTSQDGIPLSITLYGSRFELSDFDELVRCRYARVKSFLTEGDSTNSSKFVRIVRQRVSGMYNGQDGTYNVVLASGEIDQQPQDHIIFATGFKRVVRHPKLRDLKLLDTVMGQRSKDRSIYVLGAGANIPITKAEKKRFAALSNIDNSISLWRLMDRTTAAVAVLAKKLHKKVK